MTESKESRVALLIDDEAYFRRYVGQVLKHEPFKTVIEARDGREGVTLFEQHSPALVLLDISMPHMNGIETLTALRKLSPTVPIIMLTSVAEEKVVEECVGQGATFFIRKDAPAHELSAALHEALGEFFPHQTDSP